jgi:hypothetical protein
MHRLRRCDGVRAHVQLLRGILVVGIHAHLGESALALGSHTDGVNDDAQVGNGIGLTAPGALEQQQLP